MIAETGAGTLSNRTPGGNGFLAIWQCTHSIGSVAENGNRTSEHLVKGDSERVEIAAGIDRAVHPPGLFGCHVGERTRDCLGRMRRLTFTRKARGDAEPGQPRLPGRFVEQDVGRLDVFVDEPALMKLA